MDYFAANDLAAFSQLAGTAAELATAGHFDATYTSKAISTSNAGTVLTSAPFTNPDTGAITPLTDLWVHFELRASPVANNPIIEFLDAAGTSVVRIIAPATNTRRLDYWNGAAWVTTGTVTAAPGDSLLHAYDLHIVTGVAGSLNLYVDNTLVATTNGLNAAVDAIQSFKLTYFGGTGSYSQMLVSDQPTVGAKVASLTPNANGANTAWANDYLNLVKNGYNDATLVSSTTLGDKESYAASDATLPTAQHYVSSVWFAIRARLNSGAPANIKPLVRIGGTDYPGAYNFGNLSSVAFGPAIAAFTNDPSTGAAWVGVANVNAAELGFQTAA